MYTNMNMNAMGMNYQTMPNMMQNPMNTYMNTMQNSPMTTIPY